MSLHFCPLLQLLSGDAISRYPKLEMLPSTELGTFVFCIFAPCKNAPERIAYYRSRREILFKKQNQSINSIFIEYLQRKWNKNGEDARLLPCPVLISIEAGWRADSGWQLVLWPWFWMVPLLRQTFAKLPMAEMDTRELQAWMGGPDRKEMLANLVRQIHIELVKGAVNRSWLTLLGWFPLWNEDSHMELIDSHCTSDPWTTSPFLILLKNSVSITVQP